MSIVTKPLTMTRPDLPLILPERRIFVLLWRHSSGRFGMLLGVLLLGFALLGFFWTPYPPNSPDYIMALKPPNLSHLLGTEATGRDVLSRTMDGAHRSLGAAIMVLGAVFSIGMLVGIVAALSGGLVDTILMRLVDITLTLPGLVLAFAVLGILGPGFINLLIALIIGDWAWYARLARALSLNAKDSPDVIAARMAGISRWRIILGHILPQVMTHLGIVATLGLGGMISAISGFSFLGLGVQPPYAEWGAMLAESRLYFSVAPWLLLVPAGFIFLSVLASNLIGNGVRDVINAEAQQ